MLECARDRGRGPLTPSSGRLMVTGARIGRSPYHAGESDAVGVVRKVKGDVPTDAAQPWPVDANEAKKSESEGMRRHGIGARGN